MVGTAGDLVCLSRRTKRMLLADMDGEARRRRAPKRGNKGMVRKEKSERGDDIRRLRKRETEGESG